ncbi:hypothetical protein E1B28_005500 [Marasmius oreades]|uniref:Uncharacterized protein n=1 Tax=Marasmius oreades TaxID=181124 RepID=A0A9P7S3P4_9AGAR|nr:uncharacterized protein E1B28_005500 [Marasmius oreades]KAG7094680.1 hypothetical protein E1B28_005500 [Marasmius oreades]
MKELSKPLNPLNALVGVLPTNTMPLERAKRRFGIQGNAIMTGGSGGPIVIRALLKHGTSGVAAFDIPRSLETAKDAIETLRLMLGIMI